ncbi:hypothetical protein RKD27_001790 [Streptomyces sp. SAI-126]
MSICTPRALPNFGRNCEYGNDDPMVSRVSQSRMSSYEGRVPSRPIEPVTYGSSSLSASLPSSALATPAPSSSAIRSTSARAPAAPWPIRIAGLSPELRISAARSSDSWDGTTVQALRSRLEGTILNSCVGGE